MAETKNEITAGLMKDGINLYVPNVNCIRCGRFVGRDGSIEIECFEMSQIVASVCGECATCRLAGGTE